MYGTQSKATLSNLNLLWSATSRDPISEDFKNSSASLINRPKIQVICAEVQKC